MFPQHRVTSGRITAGAAAEVAKEATSEAAPASSGGLGGVFESLKEKFRPEQSTQSAADSAQQAEGNPSPPPELTSAIEADTDKTSDQPATEALIEGEHK